MKITNFNSYNLNEFYNTVYTKNIINNHYTERQMREMLSPVSITFFLEGINRMQSMLLCEQGFSYVHQSQRYVSLSKSISPVVPENIPKDLYNDGVEILHKVVMLYHQMTKLKDSGSGKKRLTVDDFKYGIPYEDARYMLPLCVPTNIAVTISGDRLIDLYDLFYNYPIIMHDIMKELNKYIGLPVVNMIMPYVHRSNIPTFNMYEYEMKSLYEKDHYVDIIDHSENGLYNAAYGALASQNEKSPERIISEWASDENVSVEKKCNDLVNNVMSYGHKSIIEQMRNTAVMKCSLSTYHQVIRHRIHKIQRDNVLNLATNKFKYYIPESINKHNKYAKSFHNVMKMYHNLFELYGKKYSNEYVSLFLPNAAYICFVVNSNASNENWIFRERLCLTAQTEIRELYDEKLRKLFHYAPDVYFRGLPPCVYGKGCKEGRMSCGKPDELIEKYGNF